MDTQVALSYTYLFMSHLKECSLSNRQVKPHVWSKFIDDMFMIWTHGKGRLCLFFHDFNTYTLIHISHYFYSIRHLDVDFFHHKYICSYIVCQPSAVPPFVCCHLCNVKNSPLLPYHQYSPHLEWKAGVVKIY